MERLIMIVAVAGVAASAACASHPPEIELTANDFDLNPLVGEWRGELSNPAARQKRYDRFTCGLARGPHRGNVS